MSRNFVVLSKSGSPPSFANRAGTPSAATPIAPTPGNEEYNELIRNLFHRVAAVAVIGSVSSDSEGAEAEAASIFSEALAAELAARGKRVVIVSVNRLLQMNPIKIPDEAAFMPSPRSKVWIWPTRAGQKLEFFKTNESSTPGTWLDCLRHNFDCVLLDSPHTEAGPAVAEITCLADSTVLAVEAGRTTKQQIQRDQRALELRGAKATGCVLIHRK